MSAPGTDKRWLDEPRNVTLLWRILIGACVALVVWELFVHGHPHFGFDSWPAFYGVFGFVAFVAVVKAGEQLRRLVKRPEDYYESGEDRR